MTFRKILCPIDFSSGSQHALRVAARLANQTNAELVLVHVWYVPPSAFAGESTFPDYVLQEMYEDAAEGLADAVRDAKALGARLVTSRLLTGVPWSEIVDLAEEPEFDLIVLGTHGRTGVSRILVGSVAEKVVRHAPCSVLAVRADGEPRPFKHVLCPVDFSDSSNDALLLAGEIARADHAAMTLLHVLELPVAYSGEPPVEDFARALDRRSCELLDKWASRLQSEGAVPVTTRSRIGRPGAGTLAVLEDDRSIDLVVIGSHGRTGIKRAVMGSVAEGVVRQAKCPVLVARRRAGSEHLDGGL